ncbi:MULTISPECIES: hypothetical protein [unclassified Helicobacter]|uniref:hypothetical protein n=1 Tax=unclassified Helicobacter TaxID=2593540 RepID=UPI00115FA6BA|nr:MULTISPECIES: hypothetical protein [unclassified Helicobacter]
MMIMNALAMNATRANSKGACHCETCANKAKQSAASLVKRAASGEVSLVIHLKISYLIFSVITEETSFSEETVPAACFAKETSFR